MRGRHVRGQCRGTWRWYSHTSYYDTPTSAAFSIHFWVMHLGWAASALVTSIKLLLCWSLGLESIDLVLPQLVKETEWPPHLWALRWFVYLLVVRLGRPLDHSNRQQAIQNCLFKWQYHQLFNKKTHKQLVRVDCDTSAF